MVILKCNHCGNNFKVDKVINWKYSHVCDSCIQRANRGNEDTRQAKADAKIDFEESMYETMIEQGYEARR